MAQPTFLTLWGSTFTPGAMSVTDVQKLIFTILASGQNADGTAYSLPVSSTAAAPVIIEPQSTTANILSGYQTFSATTAATTIITIPQNRTWVGTIGASCSCTNAGANATAALARAVLSISGASATPAAGNYGAIQAAAGANVAAGTVGDGGNNFGAIPMTISAGATATALVQVTVTSTGTTGVVDAFATGMLQ